MKNNKKVVSILSAVAVSGLSGVIAHADEVVTNEVATPVETGVSEVSAQGNLATANANLVAKEAEVSAQTQKVDESATTVSNLEADVEGAKEDVKAQEEIVAITSPEKIKEQEDLATDLERSVSENEPKVAELETSVSDLKEDVARQEGVVANREQEVTSATTDLTTAQNDLAEKEQVVAADKTSEKEVAVSEKEKEVATKTTAVSEKEQALTKAKEVEAEKERSLQDLEIRLVANKEDVKAEELAVTKAGEVTRAAEAERDTLVKGLATVSDEVSALEERLAVKNTIVLPAGFKETFNDLVLSKYRDGFVNKELSDKLTEIGKQGLATNAYKGLESDKAREITDVDNISHDNRKELTLFALDLVNQVREQMGTDLGLANESSLAFADRISKVLTKEKISNHDYPSRDVVRKEFDLASSSENISFSLAKSFTTDMNSLKGYIYENIMTMLFNDALPGWGHAINIVNARYDESTNALSSHLNRYFGLGFRITEAPFSTPKRPYTTITMRMNQVVGWAAEESTVFKTDDIFQPEDLTKALEDKKAEKSEREKVLVNQERAVAQAKSDEARANTVLEQAKESVKTTQNEINALRGGSLVEDAQRAYDTAVSDLAIATEDLRVLTSDLVTSREALAQKQADVAQAKENVVAKEGVLAQAKKNLATEQERLEMYRNGLTLAVSKVDKAIAQVTELKAQLQHTQELVARMKEAEPLLVAKRAELKTLEDKLAQAVSTLAQEREVLANLVAEKEALVIVRDKAQASFDLAENLRLERERLEQEAKERAEKERLEAERLEAERLEKERVEKELADKLEKERLEKEQKNKENLTNNKEIAIPNTSIEIDSGIVFIPQTDEDRDTKFSRDMVKHEHSASLISKVSQSVINNNHKSPNYQVNSSTSYLPKTGDSTDLSYGMLGLTLASLGLLTTKKRRI